MIGDAMVYIYAGTDAVKRGSRVGWLLMVDGN